MNFDDSYSSSSDDEINDIIQSIKNDHAENKFTIDNLIETRKNDSRRSSSNTSQKIHNDEVEENEEKFEIPSIPSSEIRKDPSLFEFSMCSNSIRVFDLSYFNDIEKKPSYPSLNESQCQALLYLNQFLSPINENILFSAIQEMINKKSIDFDNSLLGFFNKFPSKSIDYKKWVALLRKAMLTSKQEVIYILTLGEVDKFKYASDEEKHEISFELVLLHIAAFLDPLITLNSKYILVLKLIKQNLIDIKESNSFSQVKIQQLIDSCVSLIIGEKINHTSVSNIFNFISLMPTDGIGIEIVFKASLKICLKLLDCESKELNIKTLVESISKISSICNDSMSDDNVKKITTIVALTERIISAAIQLNCIENEDIKAITTKLKFNIHSTNIGMLTGLKEQIHITRMQIDSYNQHGIFYSFV